MAQSVSEFVWDRLHEWGVRRIFGYPGDGINGLIGALDAKIRIELRRTLRLIQREIGMTTIFVTHDQEEAFELADRLGVMNVGRLLEVGPPDELYLHPQTEFVATFLGTANLLVGRASADGVRIGALHFPLNTAGAGRRSSAGRCRASRPPG